MDFIFKLIFSHDLIVSKKLKIFLLLFLLGYLNNLSNQLLSEEDDCAED